MTILEEARQEAERRWPALNPGDVELTYPRGALRATARKAFERGAVWASEQVRLAGRCTTAQAERDQLAAVVEKVLSHDPLHGADSGLHCGGMAPCIRDTLATAPADALREHDAALIEGLADKWHADNTGTSPRAYNWLREKARQRREEQS